MTEAIKLVTFIDIFFVILLVLSSSFSGVFSEIIYFLAFLIPFAMGFYYSKKLKQKREEIKGVAEPCETVLHFDLKRVKSLLPLIPSSVAIVFLASLVSSLLLSMLGITAPPVEDEGIVLMLIYHALIPAVLEEALFRYIPMKVILPYSRRGCIIYSAFAFALIHCNFYQMPYAFIAGAIFMLIDVALDSVWPSVILHFINNSASIIWIKYCSEELPSVIFVSALLVLATLSLTYVLLNREKYRQIFTGAFAKGESGSIGYPPFILLIITCYIAAASLFM